jgi:molybdopterin synthase catalytic subunit
MHIEILQQAFSPWDYLQRFENNMGRHAQYGATAVFVGTMRDFNEGDQVSKMTLEHYPGMTEKELGKIAAEAMQQWELLDVLIVHRVGEISPNESIVLLAVWSAHRAAAFDASRFLMEALKSRAPFWKKEVLPEGERWVEKNTPDPGAKSLT